MKALAQARLGRGQCSPNPSVGAVAVSNGQLIAEAWHRGAGELHAERLLLENLADNIPDLTLYVTLEPCNHWGKTPPCVDLIVSYGVKKVVYAHRDPNPLVIANDTPGILRRHGIEVIYHPLKIIDDFYQSYRHWTKTGKPWVTVKLAQSLDGKIAGLHGMPVALTNDACARFTHLARSESDVILTSAKTIHQDDPFLTARLEDKIIPKPIAIIAGRHLPHPESNIFKSTKPIHIYYDESVVPPSFSNVNCHAMPAENGLLNLQSVIKHLGQLGYHDVWVEAGGRLFSALHRANLVNKTYLYIAPKVLGEQALSAFHHVDLFKSCASVSWQPMGEDVMAAVDWTISS